MPEVSFQQGIDGYTGILDTMLREASPHKSYASATSLSVDANDGGGSDNQILLRFDDLFGSGGDHPQIPVGATIAEATLTLQTNNTGGGAELHRMLSSWKEKDTYASLDDGIQADGSEANAATDLVTGSQHTGRSTLDVTDSLQAWIAAEDPNAANHGWAFLPSSSDGWDFSSSESNAAPVLTVKYTLDSEPPDETNVAPVAVNDSYSTTADQPLTIDVPGILSNDKDANGDSLQAILAGDASHGELALNADGSFSYTPADGYSGTDSFTYKASDGTDNSNTATVNLTVAPDDGTPGTAHRYDHVFLVFMENRSASQIYDNPDAPFINDVLRPAGETFTNMHAIARPSQPNYLAFYSGSTQGVTDNDPHDFGSTPTLGDQFAAAGLSLVWEAEDPPVEHHIPTTSFNDSAYERSFDSDWPELLSDLANAPEFVAFTPNNDHSMHRDGSIDDGDAWLKANFSSVIDFVQDPANNSLFVLTFDEPDKDVSRTTPIPTVAVGAGIEAGISDNTNVNLYSLLQDFEQQHNFALLGNAATAPDLIFG